jgi:Zn-dependent protease
VDLRNTKDPRLANLVVSAAGPASNFFLAGVGIVILRIIRVASPQTILDLAYQRSSAGAMAPIAFVLLSFVIVNVGLAVFNLIPIPPLDGSGVVVSVFGAPVARLYATIAPFGFLILILLINTPFLGWVFAPFRNIAINLIFGGLRG